MKSARPAKASASALEPRRHHTTDLCPGSLPAAPAPILPRPGTVFIAPELAGLLALGAVASLILLGGV